MAEQQLNRSFSATEHDAADSAIHIEPAPTGYEEQYQSIFTPDAVVFLVELVRFLGVEVNELYQRRIRKKVQLQDSSYYPDFPSETAHIRDDNTWKVSSVPSRAMCRKIDCGDVSPANLSHFKQALNSEANGIQTDFDDGHCPSWISQLQGYYNIYSVVHNSMEGVPSIDQAPILMLRPRAWNMIDHMVSIDGVNVPGPLVDFAVLMFHNGKKLFEAESGPFFYLSKLEGYLEARLWKKIFVWTENQLTLPAGTIKACVLIENILSSFEMEEILYELKDHSLGLNCGIWDYCASIISKFGDRQGFLIPDRSKYVNMTRHFLKCYMNKVIEVCHRRGAFATGGMNARVSSAESDSSVTDAVCSSKLTEVEAGVDGFMVYDVAFIPAVKAMFNSLVPGPNQLHVINESGQQVKPTDLLQIPKGGVTLDGLKNNIAIGVLFIWHWLEGEGVFIYNGSVEDSATAEISRSQVWQWMRHAVKLEETGETITRRMVFSMISELGSRFFETCQDLEKRNRILTASQIFGEIVTKRNFPEFITTYLFEEHMWRQLQSSIRI